MIKKSLFMGIGALLILVILGCRFSRGYFMAVIAACALICAFSGRNGWALLGYIMFPVVFFLNESIIGTGNTAQLIARVSIISLPLAFMFQRLKARSNMKVPIGWLLIYLSCAVLSSTTGWFPLISYFKILNFLLFIIGMKFGVQNLNGDIKEINLVRHGLLAFSAFVILGSLASYPFPGIGYSMEVDNARLWGAYGTDAEIAQDLMARDGIVLFSGMLRHSQQLAPMTAMFTAWVMCDLIFVEGRISLIHVAILAGAPLLLFLTRSRTGLLAFGVAVVVITFYALQKSTLQLQLKNRMKEFLIAGCFLMAVAAIIFEIRSQAMTKWILKWDAGESTEEMNVLESIASTRMGLIGNNMYDFGKNPLLGMGFQVVEDHKYLYQEGKISLISAPIEKGVLPTMVLGEGGILGGIVFVCFLITFYGYFIRKKYVATITLFTTFLATNMGEASFFSPGGPGGLYWLISIAGGMCIDYLSQMRNRPPPPPPPYFAFKPQ